MFALVGDEMHASVVGNRVPGGLRIRRGPRALREHGYGW